jgi:hypothetical protein
VRFLFAGSLLDSAPPDVPPRNPSMNRLNGRVATGIMGNPADRDCDFEPSYLVRTPSGNVYIPTGELEIGEQGLSAIGFANLITSQRRNIDNSIFLQRTRSGELVETLCYSPEGRGLHFRYHWFFPSTYSFHSLWPWGRLSLQQK